MADKTADVARDAATGAEMGAVSDAATGVAMGTTGKGGMGRWMDRRARRGRDSALTSSAHSVATGPLLRLLRWAPG